MTAPTTIDGTMMTDELIRKIAAQVYGTLATEQEMRFARALLSARKPAAPEGWKLVPIEPSEEMIQAACLKQSNTAFESYAKWLDSHSSGISARIRQLVVGDYRAMLATSPAAPAQSPDGRTIDKAMVRRLAIQHGLIDDAPAQSGEAVKVLDWLETEVTAISCRYHGDPSYDHDAYWMRDRVVKLLADARKVFAAPQPAQTAQPAGVLDDERAAFEQYYFGRTYAGTWNAVRDGEYVIERVSDAWKAWQARAATPQRGERNDQ